MAKQIIRLTESELCNMVEETVKSSLFEDMIGEMGMKPHKMMDKYSEALHSIVDNLVCICLYPDNPTVPNWKERACGLCKRFIELNIDPIHKNTFDIRMKWLQKAVVEVLDKDYGALINHFKTTSIYYANRPNPHDRLTPYKPYNECYEENKDRVANGVLALTQFIAEQDYNGMQNYMNNF